jgi:hypothetical protein
MTRYNCVILSLFLSFSLIGMEQGDNDNFLLLQDVKNSKEGDYPLVNTQLSNLWAIDYKNFYIIPDLATNKYDLAFDINTICLYQDEISFLCAVEDGNQEVIDNYLCNKTFLQRANGLTFLAGYCIAKEKKDELLSRKIVKIWKTIPLRKNSR